MNPLPTKLHFMNSLFLQAEPSEDPSGLKCCHRDPRPPPEEENDHESSPWAPPPPDKIADTRAPQPHKSHTHTYSFLSLSCKCGRGDDRRH